MPLVIRSLILLLSSAILLLAGCTTHPSAPNGPPSTFELSITVMNPAPEPGWLRPARFVVESDGWLRAGTGPGATRDTLPPRIRRLTHAQRETVWEAVEAAGLLDPGCPIRIAAGDGPLPDLNRPLLLLTARTDAGLHSGAVPLNSELAEPYHALIRSLTEWSWIAD